MPDKCDKCHVSFQSNDSVVKCIECKLVFHPACTRAGSVTKAKSKSWKCDACVSETSSVKSGGDMVDDRKFLMDALASLREDINSNINSKISEVQVQLNSVANDLKSINIKLNKIETEQALLSDRCEKLEQARGSLSEEAREIRLRQHDLEQYSRSWNIEITGLPQTQNEDMYTLLEMTAKAIDVPFKREDISIAHRLKLFSKKFAHPPIIVQFISRSVKESWLSSARRHRNLSSTNIGSSFQPSPVYLNDHLTATNKALLGYARRLLREKKLVFAGFFNGKILIKKKDGDTAKRVLELEDLVQYD